MRRLITTGNVSSQSWPSANTEVKIQAKSSTPSSAPTSATITFCPAGIALGDMLVAENRDSLSSIFVSKSELQYTYTAQSGEVEIANSGNLVLWPDEKVYYGNPNSANNEVAIKGDVANKYDKVSGLTFTSTSAQNMIGSSKSLQIASDGDIVLGAAKVYYGVVSANNELVKKSDLSSATTPFGYTTDGENVTIATKSTDSESGISIQGTSFVEITDRTGGGGIYLGRNSAITGGLSNVYLGNDDVEANKVATKSYVDSYAPAGALIIVGEVDASANKVASFTQGGPLSSYSEYLNHNTLTFSNSSAVTNLTSAVYSGSSYGTGYVRRGYAFVVTTAGTIEETSLAVGDLIMFYNDYPNATLNNTFKWRKL